MNFPINRRLINLFENAKTAYDESQAKKKAQSAIMEAAKKKSDENDAAALRDGAKLLEIEKKISEEQNKMDAATTVLEDGQTALQNSLGNKKVKKDNVVKANALIKMGMENVKISRNKLAELDEEKKKLLEKMKKKDRKN